VAVPALRENKRSPAGSGRFDRVDNALNDLRRQNEEIITRLIRLEREDIDRRRDIVNLHEDWVGMAKRLDNIDRRIERIERRLDLVKAPATRPERREAAEAKDRREAEVCRAYCAGSISLEQARSSFKREWPQPAAFSVSLQKGQYSCGSPPPWSHQVAEMGSRRSRPRARKSFREC
jgi:chromosome segregation ATPase